MTVIYVPSTKCPSCLFSTLCHEETKCPISKEPVKILNIREELKRFAKTDTLGSSNEIENTLSIRKSTHV
ncbi:hypothetical protein MUP77_09615 [Candidatus Bathyarchaeota archaeon]|nr:hypothetical protein [Candidatus Bathyarchaeota archaeon]